ncbi:MAG TPA: cadmium-translocating P-type ATPase [Trueperaceae bacterium]|nr:cadmium-translocating P-type ATPase [Trueperaceae bacterium]
MANTTTNPQTKPEAEVCYIINGMDCADCANKIDDLVNRTDGTANGRVSFINQTLKLNLDESITSKEQLEQKVRSLGYEIKEKTDDDNSTEPDGAWYTSKQGKLVLFSAALLITAVVLSFLLPSLSTWFYIAAIIVGVFPLARKALASTRLGNPFTIDMLVSISALGSIFIGAATEGAVVVFLFAVGELLEGIAAGKARAGIKALADLAPKTALLVKDDKVEEILAENLKINDLIEVQAGQRVAADGIIISGESQLDDSAITGESMPVSKTVDDSVYAGSINSDGLLRIKVTHDPKDNTIAKIIHLVEEAQEAKAPTARFIDRFSRWYTPLIMLIALLVAIIPPLAFAQPWHTWLYKALALLLIGCPCALVLSVPAAITSAISAAAKRGILLKGGAVLENMNKVKTIAFDKTGTLTAGKPQVSDLISLDDNLNLLKLAASVEAGSSHPLAKAIVAKSELENIDLITSSDSQTIRGKAVTAIINGSTVAVGSPRYAAELTTLDSKTQNQIDNLESAGKTAVVVLKDKKAIGIIALQDQERPEAKSAIAKLTSLGIKTIMLTGDNAKTGQAIANKLGMKVKAELMPQEKLEFIKELKQDSNIAMVGDGINDAPALAQADIGISMGGGSDVALETADAALLQDSVSSVAELVQLSHATMRNIYQNIGFALGLKAIFLVTTLLGLTGLWPAIISDTGATALVTANALRLLKFKAK